MDEGITMPISVINKIRRELLENLNKIVQNHYQNREKSQYSTNHLKFRLQNTINHN